MARALAGEAGAVVLLDLRLGLRRDVRRRRARRACASCSREAREQRARDRLHRRARRRRRPPRRGGDVATAGRSEQEQALNQILAEMDGFSPTRGHHRRRRDEPPRHARPGAAAARPLRPHGRRSSCPDEAARSAILGVHARGRPLAPDVDLAAIAERAVGMTGADLASVVNEAGTARRARRAQQIAQADLLDALEAHPRGARAPAPAVDARPHASGARRSAPTA